MADAGRARHESEPAFVLHSYPFRETSLIIEAFTRKRLAGDNPWGPAATTLEWTLSSPPPFHQYSELPKVH